MKLKSTLLLASFVLIISTCLNAQDSRPNFIIFIADDVSWSDFGCYGNRDVQTPNIDKLASQGILFTNAYLTASSCSPSRNSIMTGRYPHNTGAAELHTQPPLDMASLPKVLRNSGYFCGQAGKFHMGDYIRPGFDVIHENGSENGDGGELFWLKTLQERTIGKPFFMWYAAYDAHRAWGPNSFSGTHKSENITPPFYLANGEATKADLGQYYDEIYRFDYHIGQVIRELKNQHVLENTMIIVMADNGRPFPHSKTRVNDRGMKTPFIIHWPAKIEKTAVCKSLISSIDIAPSILSLAGLKAPVSFQGKSFEKLITDPGSDFRQFIFAEHNWHDYEAHERMVRNKEFMYILNSRPMQAQMGPADAVGSPSFNDLDMLKSKGELSAIQADVFVTPRPVEELFDIEKDPLQLLNVASVPSYQKQLKKLQSVLYVWMDKTGDNIPENLTKDWYLHEPGYIQTGVHGERGEMPGAKNNATQNNHSGPF